MLLVTLFTTYVIGQTQQPQQQQKPAAPAEKSAAPAEKPVKTEIKAADLPKKATEYLAKEMKDFTVEKVFKNEFHGDVTYSVYLAKGTEKNRVHFDKEGNFIKKPASGGTGQLGTPPPQKPADATKPAPATKPATDPAKK